MRLLVIALLLLPSMVSAQLTSDLQALEQRYQLLEQHQTRLESRLGEQGKRIARLKSQLPGVRRDFQLDGALKENFELASKLTELRQQLQDLAGELEQRYEQLIAKATDPQERAKLRQQKQQLVAQRPSGPIRIVTEERVDPLDNPEDLEAKADLLQDSAEKLRRQLRQVQRQLAHLEHRARLQRHSRALEDSPFFESSPRRTGHTRKTSADSSSGSAGNQSPSSETPPAAQPGEEEASTGGGESLPSNDGRNSLDPQSGYDSAIGNETPSAPTTPEVPSAPDGIRQGDSPPSGSTGQEALVVSIQDVLDPAVLRELTASGGSSSDLKARISALRQAQQQLKQMANQLGTRAHKLRRQAKSLRHQR